MTFIPPRRKRRKSTRTLTDAEIHRTRRDRVNSHPHRESRSSNANCPARSTASTSVCASHAAVRKFFKDDAHMAAAKGAQAGHWVDRAGQFDARYVGNIHRIGLSHARVGLEPRWYVGGYSVILDMLVKAVIAELWPKGLISRGGGAKAAEVGATSARSSRPCCSTWTSRSRSIWKLSKTDERKPRRRSAPSSNPQCSGRGDRRGAQATRAKRLTYRISSDLPEDFGMLQSNFNEALDQLQQAMRGVIKSADAIGAGAAKSPRLGRPFAANRTSGREPRGSRRRARRNHRHRRQSGPKRRGGAIDRRGSQDRRGGEQRRRAPRGRRDGQDREVFAAKSARSSA